MSIKKILLPTFVILVGFFSFTNVVCAKPIGEITDWYIQDFKTDIVVNKDSSLLITENIVADCGNLPNKHGIFRVLPTEIKTNQGVYKTPIELISITDFDNNLYQYQEIKNYFNHTITWKIGDPDVAVRGVNYYKIMYRVKNAVRFGNKNFDELYWNLMGNFWDIGTDNFSAKIFFPLEINSRNSAVDYYTGALGSKIKTLADYSWTQNNVLSFKSNTAFYPQEGVSVSITFPKNIFVPYTPTFIEKYGDSLSYLFFVIPFFIFIFAFSKWRKNGKDPKMKKPIPPEFGIPENITPIQMGVVLSHGRWRNNLITAAIIDLAVRKFIIIEQTETKVLFFTQKDILLKKNTNNYDLNKVTETEKFLLEGLFKDGVETVKLSNLRDKFYQKLPTIIKSATDDVVGKGWIVKKGSTYSIAFSLAGFVLFFCSFLGLFFSWQLFVSALLSGTILLIFGIIMPKRTQTGVDLLFKIKGFELYMKKAEDYRQQFYEKENIFDKFLPYAIVFGIAGLWAKKMQLIYGESYFKNYHPVWFVGSTTNFDLNSFNSQLNSITSSISSNIGGSSGAGGAGGAGGGGGGGGGGGW